MPNVQRQSASGETALKGLLSFLGSRPQAQHQDGRGGHAVRVVIPVNADALSFLNGLHDSLRGFPQG